MSTLPARTCTGRPWPATCPAASVVAPVPRLLVGPLAKNVHVFLLAAARRRRRVELAAQVLPRGAPLLVFGLLGVVVAALVLTRAILASVVEVEVAFAPGDGGGVVHGGAVEVLPLACGSALVLGDRRSIHGEEARCCVPGGGAGQKRRVVKVLGGMSVGALGEEVAIMPGRVPVHGAGPRLRDEALHNFPTRWAMGLGGAENELGAGAEEEKDADAHLGGWSVNICLTKRALVGILHRDDREKGFISDDQYPTSGGGGNMMMK